MDKGGAAIHLDPPNHPPYPPNTGDARKRANALELLSLPSVQNQLAIIKRA